MLVISLIFAGKDLGRGESESIFSFGEFDNIDSGRTNYRTYEIFIFGAIGVAGGCMGALFNWIHLKVSLYREQAYKREKWKRLAEMFGATFTMAIISFGFSAAWQQVVHNNVCLSIIPINNPSAFVAVSAPMSRRILTMTSLHSARV